MSEKNYGNNSQLAEIVKYISDTMKFPVLGAGGGFAPIGTINFFDASVAPQGWLACDGSVVNIADYPDLATYYASVHGSSNFYGGNGTTTFAVPDLRGEFLRGTGTNSHTNQGDGANVGVHQDGTQVQNLLSKSGSLQLFRNNNDTGNREVINYDKKIKGNSTVYIESNQVIGLSYDYPDTIVGEFTSRPTNTSFLICVKATVAGDPNAHVYSTEERVVGTWIDGKPLYQKTLVLSLSDFTNASGWYRYYIQGSDMLMVDFAHSFIESIAGTYYMALPYLDTSSGIIGFQLIKDGNGNGGFMFCGNRMSSIANGYVFTVQYTKTTS